MTTPPHTSGQPHGRLADGDGRPSGAPSSLAAGPVEPSAGASLRPPVAGWYPDENPYLSRFWDGAAWTDQTTVRAIPMPAPLPEPSHGAATSPGGRPPVVLKSRTSRAGRGRILALALTAALVGGALLLADRFPPPDPGTGTSTSSTEPPKTPKRAPFRTCAGARKAGAVPLTEDHPRYNPLLDADHDGVACDR